MKLSLEEKETIFNVVNQYLKDENISIYAINKRKILSRKTLDKILKKNYISLEEKTLKKILTFPKLNKASKDEIKNILIAKKENIKKPVNNLIVRQLLEEIMNLRKENEKLKENFEKTYEVLNRRSLDNYNDKLKNNAFRSDFETTTKIIPLLWKLRDETSALFSELELLLAINSNEENIKMSRGLKKVGKDLIEMGEKIIKYSEKNIIIDLED